MFCDLIGLILNNVTDLIGAKTTKGKGCCLNVSSRLWEGGGGERYVTILKTAAMETTVYESRQTSKLKTTVL